MVTKHSVMMVVQNGHAKVSQSRIKSEPLNDGVRNISSLLYLFPLTGTQSNGPHKLLGNWGNVFLHVKEEARVGPKHTFFSATDSFFILIIK